MKDIIFCRVVIKEKRQNALLTKAYPGKHYDMYKEENLKSTRKTAIEWFVKYLKGS